MIINGDLVNSPPTGAIDSDEIKVKLNEINIRISDEEAKKLLRKLVLLLLLVVVVVVVVVLLL